MTDKAQARVRMDEAKVAALCAGMPTSPMAPLHDRVLFIKNSDNEADVTLFLDAV